MRPTALSLSLAMLVAYGVGDSGWLMPATVIGSTGLGLGLLYWLFPRGLEFAIGTSAGQALYATLFTVLGRAQFPDAPDWSRALAYLLPVVALIGMAAWRRRELASIISHPAGQDLEQIPYTARWLLYTALVGVACFVLPVNRQEPMIQAAVLLVAMAVIAGIVAVAERDVVRLLADVSQIMDEISTRLRHLVVPATAFLLLYALAVVFFAAAYRISDGLSLVPLFNGPGGPIRITYSDALHFSLATLSTVGYGDIHPHDNGIRVLASLQVVTGQLLLLFGFAEIMRARENRVAARHLDHKSQDGHSPPGG
ncbi:MAG TPA: potassium channel family protein [Falsiroseomonas sp.]|nr:potassium channel family protein [Falsiroseomonas sp.]